VLRKLREMYPLVLFRFTGFDHVNGYDHGSDVLLEGNDPDIVESSSEVIPF
jgi:hypothetical protein